MTPIQQALAHFKDSHNEWTASQITDYLKSLLPKEKEFVGKVWDGAQPTVEWSEGGNEIEGVSKQDKDQYLNKLYAK